MSLNIYILAGGKSSRMGEEKGLVLFHNKPLIQHVIDVVVQLEKPIFIVTSNQLYKTFGFPLVEDMKKGLGPAGGIDTILQHSEANKNLVLACDMPFIDIDSVQTLLNEKDNAQIIVPQLNLYPESLFAIYSTSCASRWHHYVEQGILKMSDLLSYFETKFVDGDELCKLNPNLFRNMNSKDDINEWNIKE